jgi:5-amino-6-(5-phosphoribosylamino)uracil reductase
VIALRPYVLLSAAMSADGYIDDGSPQRLVLSGPEDLDRVDELRAGCDAIMVGAQTVRSDDPRLLVRSPVRRDRRRGLGQPASPAKVTITATGELDPQARFFAADGAQKLVYASAGAAAALSRRLGDLATVVSLEEGTGLAAVLADLPARGIARLMIEGGARVLGEALGEGLADEFLLAIAPIFVADPAAPRLLARGAVPGPMVLAGLERAGDVAVLRYLPGDKPVTKGTVGRELRTGPTR